MSVIPTLEKKKEKGQSLIELTLVVIFLMILLLGIAEYGTLLNQYLNLLDASREAARVAGDLSWEDYCTDFGDGPCSSEIETDRAKEDFFMDTIALAQVVMEPITLDATRGDDIVVSYFVVDTDRTIVRYPIKPIQHSLNDIQESKISDADIRAQLDPCGPARGILLVEIFYNYSHRLKLPVFSAIVPDPIPVYTYAIMPMHKVQPLEPEPVPEDCLEEEA